MSPRTSKRPSLAIPKPSSSKSPSQSPSQSPTKPASPSAIDTSSTTATTSSDSAMPASPASPSSPRVRFAGPDPVTGSTRPLATFETGSFKQYEEHAAVCSSCHNSYDNYTRGQRLCAHGRALALDASHHAYYRNGHIYAHRHDGGHPVRLEVESGRSSQIFQALKLIKRHGLPSPYLAAQVPYYGLPTHHHGRPDSGVFVPYTAPPPMVSPYAMYTGMTGYGYAYAPPAFSYTTFYPQPETRQPRSPTRMEYTAAPRNDSVAATIGPRPEFIPTRDRSPSRERRNRRNRRDRR
ncbi:hypothetical protein ANO11243_078810 [Dothideomycetidae sp. 11243]|nr:hypothetical protein ANO11243_078810 [fungal sp. No.11243]